MNDTLCQDFFRQPAQRLHRRYEALRAFFVEHRPLPEVAQAFGFGYGTLRNLVADFRAQCRAGAVPPFSPSRPVGGRAAKALPPSRQDRVSPPWPTAASSP
jgi:hypothetical protein